MTSKTITSQKVLFSVILVLLFSSNILFAFSATKTKIYPMDDTYVDYWNDDANYGGDYKLEVKGSYRGISKVIYLKFDLSSISSNVEIVKAAIHLYTISVHQTMTIIIHYCSDNSWKELDLTWNNQPDYESEGGTWKIAKSNEWYGFIINDVSYEEKFNFLERALKTKDKLLTVVITSETETIYLPSFRSKDQQYSWAEEYKPYLEIEYKVQPSIDGKSSGRGGIPGFPYWESIAFLVLGILILWMLQRKR